MRVSSSSSSESAPKKVKKKGDKGKGDKGKSKKDKKQKKELKKDKKDNRRAERAEAWDCDRAEIARLLGQLLLMDPGTADDLQSVFASIDGGETVDIDGLEDRRAKKKLRHLLQAMRLAPAEGRGFRTPDRGVSFLALFLASLRHARGVVVPEPAAASERGPAAAAERGPEAAGEAAGEAADEGGGADGGAGTPGPAEGSRPPPRRRVTGPQLPMPAVAAEAIADEASGSEEDDAGAERGPRLEGAERRGVDLDDLPSGSAREDWMTKPHEALAAAFGDAKAGGRRSERFEVKRSRKEQGEFEEMMKSRGPSLLEQSAQGGFEEHRGAAEHIQKRLKDAQGVWGASAQERKGHRGFDPEQDMTERKPMTGTDFSKLVENSVAGLAGRFGRGNVTTSFL